MIKYNVGEIYIIYEGTKNRPIVIINNGLGLDIDISIARITTKSKRNEFDVVVEKWKEAGLQKPSIVRCSKLNTIKPGKHLIKIGQLHKNDMDAVRDAVQKYISLGFKAIEENNEN